VSVLLALLAQGDFLDPGGGPDTTGGFRVSPTIFIVMFGLGFLLSTIGHVYRSRVLVAAGIMLIFLSTVLIPIALQASN
jgi:hypothetical protein